MVHAIIAPDIEPVEERIEVVGTLEAGEKVPPDHFGLILRAIPADPTEERVGRYVRSGERTQERCDLYRIRRVVRS